MANGPQLTIENLPFDLQNKNYLKQTSNLSLDLSTIEKIHIQRVLNYTKGNKVETAKLLNIGLTTLYRKIEEYNLNNNFWDSQNS